MSWKDDYRDEKEALGLTWDEFHERQFVHVDDLDDATETLADLREHVAAVRTEYRDLKREFHELKVLLEAEQGGDS